MMRTDRMSWVHRKRFRLFVSGCTVPVALLLILAAHPLHAQNKRLLAYYTHSLKHKGFAYNANNIPYDELTHIDDAFLRSRPQG